MKATFSSAIFLSVIALTASAQAEETFKLDAFNVSEQAITIGDQPERTVSKLDVYNTAGAGADVNKALQILPGVNLVDEGNALYIKGGSADETKTYVNDIPFPTTHQSDAPTGTNDTSMATTYTQKISLYAGNVPVNYGNELSGVVALETLAPTATKTFNLNLSVGGVSGLAQLPLKNDAALDIGSSLSDAALLFKINPTAYAYTIVPRSEELFGSNSFKPTETTDSQFVGYQKNTEAAFLLTSPSFTGVFKERVNTSFVAERLKGITQGGWEWKVAAGFGDQVRSESIGTLVIADHSRYTALTSNWTKELSQNVTIGLGADMLFSHGGVSGTVPTGDTFSASAPVIPLDYFRTDKQFAGYTSISLRPLPATELSLGGRLDSFLGQPGGTLGQPRVSGAWHINHQTSVHFYVGEQSKSATPSQLAAGLNRLNPARMREESVTLSRKGKGYSIEVSGFLKNYRDLNEYNRQYLAVGGNQGRARGATLGAKLKPIKHVVLGADYTLTHSDRTDPNTGLLANSPFDVRNTLALTTQFQIGYSTVSLAYRFATGKPYTPITGSAPSGIPGIYAPIYGAPGSLRLPDFNRFDINLNRLQFIGKSLWVPYISVTNVFNHDNVSGYNYSADYTMKFPKATSYRRTIYFGVSTTF